LVKPDLVAPAVRVTGPVSRDAAADWCAQHGVFCNEAIAAPEGVTYGFSAGTSFAAPAVAGAAAVVRKWYNVTLKPGLNPSPAMTKAILVNGARDLNGAQVLNAAFGQVQLIRNILYQPYNDYQGWGMLNLTRLLDAAGNHFAHDQEFPLSGNNSWAVTRLITNGAAETRITVAWTDVASSQGTHYNVVNNLDLLVCNNSGTVCYYANRFNTSGFSLPTPPNPSFSDGSNVVEEVVIPANTFPTGQVLLISVYARNVMIGSQDFALFGSNAH
jgi:Subtilase family